MDVIPSQKASKGAHLRAKVGSGKVQRGSGGLIRAQMRPLKRPLGWYLVPEGNVQ